MKLIRIAQSAANPVTVMPTPSGTGPVADMRHQQQQQFNGASPAASQLLQAVQMLVNQNVGLLNTEVPEDRAAIEQVASELEQFVKRLRGMTGPKY